MTRDETMDSLFAFAIGEVVALKLHVDVRHREGAKQRTYVPALQCLQVIERVAQQCHGGVQLFYVVRPHMTGKFDGMAIATELMRLCEIELAPLPESIAATETL